MRCEWACICALYTNVWDSLTYTWLTINKSVVTKCLSIQGRVYMQMILDLLYLKVSYAHWPLVGLLTRHYTSGLRQEKAPGYNDNGTKYSDIPKLMACPLDAWKTFCSLRSRGRRRDLKEYWVRSRDTADFLFTRQWEKWFLLQRMRKAEMLTFYSILRTFSFLKMWFIEIIIPPEVSQTIFNKSQAAVTKQVAELSVFYSGDAK